MIGRRIGGYEVLSSIGSGGMGAVYRARDLCLDRDVAIKVLTADSHTDPTSLGRMTREAKLLASLNHPNIATIYGLEEHEGAPCIVLELIDGESLDRRLRSGRLKPAEALEIGRQVAAALESAHEHDIIHRDLKPANIMITADGLVKVLDFGIARRLGLGQAADGGPATAESTGLTAPGELAGTIPYMSPEQVRGVPLDKRSDIWAFGCVLFEMLAGRRAFGRETAADTLAAILESEPEWQGFPEGIPDTGMSLLRRCLHKDPQARLRDLGDARIELGEALQTLTPTFVTSPATTARRSDGSSTPSRWLPPAAAVAFFALVVSALYIFFPTEEQAAVGIGSSGRPAVAVVGFENRTGSDDLEWLAAGVPEMLLTDLAQTPGLDVVASQQIYEVLSRMDVNASETPGYMEVARRVGAGAVVTGSVFAAGGDTRIDVQVADVESGRLLSVHSVTGAEIFPLVDQLAGFICDGLGVTSSTNPPVAQVTTESLEAYRLYFEAQAARRNLRLAEAHQLLLRSIQLDPDFGLAHLEQYQVAQRNENVPLIESSREAVRRVIGQMPERDRLYAEALLARDDLDFNRAVSRLEELLERFPDHRDAYVLLSSVFAYDFDDVVSAVEVVQRGAAALPASSNVQNQLGYLLLRANRFPEAIEAFEEYARLAPEEPNTLDSLGDAYLMTGEPQKALDLYDQVVAQDSTYIASHMGRAWALAMLGDYRTAMEAVADSETAFGQAGYLFGAWAWTGGHMLSRAGRYQEATELFDRGADLAAQAQLPVFLADFRFAQAIMTIERGDYAAAIRYVARGVAAFADADQEDLIDPDDPARREMFIAQLLFGTAQARAGDLQAARRSVVAQERLTDSRTQWEEFFYRTLEGEVALAAGDLDAAAAAFGAAEPDVKMWFVRQAPVLSVFANNLSLRDGRARVRVARGDLAGAIRIYRELTTPRIDSKYTAMLEPRFVLELARLLDRAGDTEAAAAEYRRFLELWADADGDGGLLGEEARTRLAALRRPE